MVAMGDALAMALLTRRDFRPEDFAVFHPGRSLGKRLLLTVADVVFRRAGAVGADRCHDAGGDRRDAHKRGTVPVVDDRQRVVGVVTNGDLMRLMEETDQFSRFRSRTSFKRAQDDLSRRAGGRRQSMENHGMSRSSPWMRAFSRGNHRLHARGSCLK